MSNTPELLHRTVIEWFDDHARDLPWRTDPEPWAVLVSEFMLQQTPVARVLPVYAEWMTRWPTPASLAASSTGDAVRAWGRLGYPRRALRLHAAAVAIVERHDGSVPADPGELLELPGVGSYTAAAVASFAFGQRHAVLDTNVRRLFARVIDGEQYPAPAPTVAERQAAEALLPATGAHRWAAATMELGAVVCTARSPHCGDCPITDLCAWHEAGSPVQAERPRRGQPWTGTDRQVRGKLLAVLRDADGPVDFSALDAAWPDAGQRERCLDSLLDDGLAELTPDARVGLPT
ncbi:MAG TPA: A/G-specific adenine glycosylase [Aeromicrobium sp.]|nr:A/G-specific adenine glycosylase [Aeromicrobium sp.]